MSGTKVIENRLRRVSGRRGLVLVKSRRRDKGCPWHGKWVLTELHGSRVLGLIHGRDRSSIGWRSGIVEAQRLGFLVVHRLLLRFHAAVFSARPERFCDKAIGNRVHQPTAGIEVA